MSDYQNYCLPVLDQSTVRQSAMDKVVITFYVSSLSMLKKIPGQVYEMFSDEDMKNLAESIAQVSISYITLYMYSDLAPLTNHILNIYCGLVN